MPPGHTTPSGCLRNGVCIHQERAAWPVVLLALQNIATFGAVYMDCSMSLWVRCQATSTPTVSEPPPVGHSRVQLAKRLGSFRYRHQWFDNSCYLLSHFAITWQGVLPRLLTVKLLSSFKIY
jgi:hypothetical protein